jgi:hypothetical protein
MERDNKAATLGTDLPIGEAVKGCYTRKARCYNGALLRCLFNLIAHGAQLGDIAIRPE